MREIARFGGERLRLWELCPGEFLFVGVRRPWTSLGWEWEYGLGCSAGTMPYNKKPLGESCLDFCFCCCKKKENLKLRATSTFSIFHIPPPPPAPAYMLHRTHGGSRVKREKKKNETPHETMCAKKKATQPISRPPSLPIFYLSQTKLNTPTVWAVRVRRVSSSRETPRGNAASPDGRASCW